MADCVEFVTAASSEHIYVSGVTGPALNNWAMRMRVRVPSYGDLTRLFTIKVDVNNNFGLEAQASGTVIRFRREVGGTVTYTTIYSGAPTGWMDLYVVSHSSMVVVGFRQPGTSPWYTISALALSSGTVTEYGWGNDAEFADSNGTTRYAAVELADTALVEGAASLPIALAIVRSACEYREQGFATNPVFYNDCTTAAAVHVDGSGNAQNLTVTGSPADVTGDDPGFEIFGDALVDLTHVGTPIVFIDTPTGGGNHDIECIRDGISPIPGTALSALQYDTYHGGGVETEDWVGYEFGESHTFARVIFQEGRQFGDGGWFEGGITVQVFTGSTWDPVSGQVATPTYAEDNGTSFESYQFDFDPIAGTAIRIHGAPGGAAFFTTYAELWVYEQAAGGAAELDVGIGAELDSAIAGTASKQISTGVGLESAAAFARGWVSQRATEIEQALAPAITDLVPAGLSTSMESALSISLRKAVTAGVATESDSALGVAARKQLASGTSTEVDASFGQLDGSQEIATGVGGESDAAHALLATKVVGTGFATEVGSALAAAVARSVDTGASVETGSALSVLASKHLSPASADEADAALSLLDTSSYVSPGVSSETAAALSLAIHRQVPTGTAEEAASALAATVLKIALTGLASETNRALGPFDITPLFGVPIFGAWAATVPPLLGAWASVQKIGGTWE